MKIIDQMATIEDVEAQPYFIRNVNYGMDKSCDVTWVEKATSVEVLEVYGEEEFAKVGTQCVRQIDHYCP